MVLMSCSPSPLSVSFSCSEMQHVKSSSCTPMSLFAFFYFFLALIVGPRSLLRHIASATWTRTSLFPLMRISTKLRPSPFQTQKSRKRTHTQTHSLISPPRSTIPLSSAWHHTCQCPVLVPPSLLPSFSPDYFTGLPLGCCWL